MEETEHALYNRVRAAEMQRRKQEQDVQRLFSDLESLTKDNEKRMKVLCRVRLYIKLLRYLSLNNMNLIYININFLARSCFFPFRSIHFSFHFKVFQSSCSFSDFGLRT